MGIKAIPSKSGWMYYTGRSEGAIEALGHHIKDAKFVPRSESSIIGMLVDCDVGGVVFALNGDIQGACELPACTPLWVLTHVDTRADHVELKKLSLEAAPCNLDALKGALLTPSNGKKMHRDY